MRIAQIAPLYESVPPVAYGATERIVHYLTQELVAQGHDVTLFASGDSRTSARLVAGSERALWHDERVWDTQAHHLRQLGDLLRAADAFDIVHFHGEPLHFLIAGQLPCRHVTTMHGLLLPDDHGPLLRAFPDIPLVSISKSQRRPVPWANWRRTVYHGLPRDALPFSAKSDDYLLFIGRITPGKQPHFAIEIARRAGMRLKMAAAVHEGERAWFHEAIEPLLHDHRNFVEYLGEVGGRDRDALLSNARALLMPIGWEEPFGLVMVEAMACGTPVVAFGRGAVPEIIDDHVTGRIVDDVDGAVNALATIECLDRRACRQAFEARFTARRMTDDYLDVYRSLLDPATLSGAELASARSRSPCTRCRPPNRTG
jgi:glycosyltransferase involved in cell wall biosynthesis